MNRGHFFLRQIEKKNDFSSDTIPLQSIIEIVGNRRVLIENHYGVISYGVKNIAINVRSGIAFVSGNNLEIVHMSREQLVICGKIDAVSLQRRETS